MRNYRRYFIGREDWEIENPPGTWTHSFYTWQIGRTEDEFWADIASDQSFVAPPFRFSVDSTSWIYFLLDSDELQQIAFRYLNNPGPQYFPFRYGPSPRKDWSGGK